MEATNESGWAMNEFHDVNLGDERLNKRLIKLFDSLSESPESPINQACGDWAETKAAYRFFQNENVVPEEILKSHKLRTQERVQKHETVLAIQDTSYIMYTSHPSTTGIAKLTVKKGKRVDRIYSKGLLMHSCLACTTDGVPLGLLDQNIFSRSPDKPALRGRTKDVTPIEDKESYRWLEMLQNSTGFAAATRVVTVCDREADMYEFFQLSHEIQSPVLVRASHNRAVNKRSMYTEDRIVRLWEHLEQESCAGSVEIEVPSRKGSKHTLPRAARTARLELRYSSLKLNPPKRLSSQNPDIDMCGILLQEVDPPHGVEPLEWMLLTNISVENFDQAYEKVQWYCLRWRIESFHRVLKSGFNVEKCRLETADRLMRYLTVMSIIAWRLFMITLIARTNPDLPCNSFLEDDEWRVLFRKVHRNRKPPRKAPTMAQAIIWIAQLGGFLNRKSDGNPGPTHLWRGWKRLHDITHGFKLAMGT